jgi:hypothetical protein
MMYEMLVGEQPFRGEQPVQIAYQHANDSVPAPSLKNPAVPRALDELTLWATARDAEQRPRDARAMLDQLFETQHLMRNERSGTGPQQRTTVLPAATTRVIARTETPVARQRERTAAVPVASTQRLVLATARAHRRGAWTFGIVLLAGLLAAGTGWWFGSGPGAPPAQSERAAFVHQSGAASPDAVLRAG